MELVSKSCTLSKVQSLYKYSRTCNSLKLERKITSIHVHTLAHVVNILPGSVSLALFTKLTGSPKVKHPKKKTLYLTHAKQFENFKICSDCRIETDV
jgi:hypothetical protein